MAGAVIRRFTPADATLLAVLVDGARDAGELLASSDPHGDWMVRQAIAEPGQVAVADSDGALVGFVLPEAKALVVVPARRREAIGRALVEEGREIERERGRPDLLLGVLPVDDGGRAFLSATGFTLHSSLWDLDLSPAVTVVEPAWPSGVRARTFDRANDIEPWVDLFNAAFADHATPLRLDPLRALADWDDSPFRDVDLLLVEEAGGSLIGFCATEPRRRPDDSVEPRGEIWTIGVRPDRQGAGLGRQLLRWGVGHLRGLGVETVALAVNGRNPRALGLYEAEGFGRVATRDRWARPVAPFP